MPLDYSSLYAKFHRKYSISETAQSDRCYYCGSYNLYGHDHSPSLRDLEKFATTANAPGSSGNSKKFYYIQRGEEKIWPVLLPSCRVCTQILARQKGLLTPEERRDFIRRRKLQKKSLSDILAKTEPPEVRMKNAFKRIFRS